MDLKKGTVTVSGALVPDENGKFILKDTNKNESSQRVVPILIPQLSEALKQAKDKTGPVYTHGPNALIKRINNICKRAGLPLVGVHGLRHSFASLSYHLGLSQMETMQIGGWADTKTMQKIYTHLATKDKEDAVEKMKNFFSDTQSR